jgi:hypothetical protein
LQAQRDDLDFAAFLSIRKSKYACEKSRRKQVFFKFLLNIKENTLAAIQAERSCSSSYREEHTAKLSESLDAWLCVVR